MRPYTRSHSRLFKSSSASSSRVKAAHVAGVVVNKRYKKSRGKKKDKKLNTSLLPVTARNDVKRWSAEELLSCNVYADGGNKNNKQIQPKKDDNKNVIIISINNKELFVPKQHVKKKGNGKGLCYVQDNVFQFVLCPRHRSLEETKVAGAGMQAKLIDAYCDAIDKGSNNKRGSKCSIKSNTAFKYVCAGAAPNRASRGVTPVHHVIRNLDQKSQKMILDHFKGIERLFKEFLPTSTVQQVLGGIDLVDAKTFTITNGKSSEIYASFAVGKNVFLNSHTDDDFTYSCTTLLCSDESKKNVFLAYFCFPRLGIAVPLRPGDTLFFNAREPHMISSRTTDDVDIYCLSFYLKSKVIGGNDNKKELNEEQKYYVTLFDEMSGDKLN